MSGTLSTGYHSQHVGWLTFSNPGKRNALSLEMWKALPSALDALSDNPELRVLIVTGEGNHFSSGGDISEFETVFKTWDSSKDFSDAIDAAFEKLVHFRAPTIAKIRGGAVGGGCGLALACDVRMVDATAFFAVTPAKLGIVYPFPEIARLTATVGVPMAKDILFSARKIRTEEALRIGLANQAFAAKDLDAEVLKYAETLARHSPNSLQITKRVMAHIETGGFDATETITQDITSAFQSDDFKEGYQAFLEKRAPKF